MPDSGLPPWARTIGRTLRALLFAFTVVVAVGDIWFTSSVIIASSSTDQFLAGGAAGLLAGSAGLAGVLLRRWRWEWVAASVAAFTLASRALPVWFTLGDNALRLSAAAGMTVAAIGMAYRALELWVFAVTTGTIARQARAKRTRL